MRGVKLLTTGVKLPDRRSVLDKLKQLEKCDLIITDQNMGNGMSGLDLVQYIRKANTQCKVYVVSNEPKAIFEELALKAGADGYFNVPINKFELGRVLIRV